jgi:hypothetical protein
VWWAIASLYCQHLLAFPSNLVFLYTVDKTSCDKASYAINQRSMPSFWLARPIPGHYLKSPRTTGAKAAKHQLPTNIQHRIALPIHSHTAPTTISINGTAMQTASNSIKIIFSPFNVSSLFV